MPYDALGNYVPGDEEPSLEEMRLSLEKSQRPSTDTKRTIADVLMRYNPVMMQKSLQDVPRAAYNMSVAPLLSTWAGTLGNVQAEGAAKIYEALGKPEEAARVRRKIEPVSPANFQATLQTPEGEAFQEGTGKAMEAAKVPHMWPVGVPNPNARPMLTPNDVRVMGAEAARVGRQVRDIPMDFSNAQSGFTRIDPVTGKPTMGARLQGAAEDVGRIVEQRRAAGESTIPGVPEVFTPETRAYAVRPAGTSLVMPQNLPKGMESSELNVSTATLRALEDTLGPIGAKMTPDDALGHISYARDHTPNVNIAAFGDFEKRKAMELYPDAPNAAEAFEAMITAIPAEDRRLAQLKRFDEFKETPEGIAAGYGQLPSSTELYQRDEAARNWLYGPFINYVKKHFGAVGDPMVKLASEGITYESPGNIEPLDTDIEGKTVRDRRQAAGLPIEGTVAPALHAAQAKLSEAEAKVNELNTKRERYRDIALQQGLTDPAQLPEFAKLTNPLNVAVAARDKLQQQVQNLELGKLYEDRADLGVMARTPEKLLTQMDYRTRQFYPSVTRAKPGETLYATSGRSALRNLGYDRFVTEFYNKVLEGEIPIEKLKSLTVEKAVRQLAEPRIAKERAEAKAALTYKTDVETVMKRTTDQYTKPENYFGNVAALELTKDSGLDVPTFTRILSEDTTVLDHCIAQGGSAGDRLNPWFPGKKRNYDAIYNVLTGQLNPNAGRDTSSYVNSIVAGDMITSFRDSNTGVPVATFQFHRSHIGNDGQQKYSIGYASGYRNGQVKPEYAEGIKNYLNAQQDKIAGVGGNLSENLGIYDKNDLSSIRRDLSLKQSDIGLVDWDSMPRFSTGKEIKDAIRAARSLQRTTEPSPAVARPQAGGPLQPTDRMPEALRNDVQSAFANAVEHLESLGADDASNEAEASRRLSELLIDVTDRYFTSNATGDNLTNAIDYLERVRNNYNNQGGLMQMLIANEGVTQALTDLEGIRSAAERGHYTPAAPAQVPGPLLPMTVQQLDQFIADTYRNMGVDIGNGVREAVANAAAAEGTSISNLLATQPTRLAELLNDAADNTVSHVVEEQLRELARILTLPDIDFGEPAQAPAQRVFGEADFDNFIADIRQNQDAQVAHDLVRTANIVANELGTNVRGALENRPTEFASRLAELADDAENGMLEIALNDLANRIAPPIRDVNTPIAEQLMEPEPGHPANEPDVMPQHRSIANLLANGDLDELRTTRFALGLHDNAPNLFWSVLPVEQRIAADRAFAERIQQLEQQQANAPQQQQVADFRPIADHAARLTYNELREALTPGEIGEVSALHDSIVRDNPNDADVLSNAAQLVYNYQIGPWENLSDTERAMLYMELTYTANRMRNAQEPPQQATMTHELRTNADDALEMFESALDDLDDSYAANSEIDRALYELRLGEDQIYGLWDGEGPMTPTLREYFIQRLEALQRELGGEEPDGHANGGLIRGYQSGGKVEYPPFYRASNQAITRAQEMHPNYAAQDNQTDAARHMLASGYMSQSFGPTIAKGLGYLHEFKEAPFRTAGHMLGLSKPRYDYEMDVHNNALGIELAQKAKSRAEFEKMVQDALRQSTTTTEPGRPRIMTPEQANEGRDALKYANGGTVSQSPSLDDMRFELQLRSK